ncbi:MAG TPA: TlpA disulfide reductase family protein [Verrucomicrobiae bacterium]|nr:TlpA disulfide reductase family protein [Verrucomicrobiae bacterium]
MIGSRHNRLNIMVTLATGVFAACAAQKTDAPIVSPATSTAVLQAVHEPGAKVVLVNMWATWCGPCREEFPDIVKLAKKYRDRGLRVVFVSWDDEAGVAQRFLGKQGVDFPSYIKTASESDPHFINAIEPRWTGAFPATIIFDGSGKVRAFWEGASSYSTFEKNILDVLNQQTQEAKS